MKPKKVWSSKDVDRHLKKLERELEKKVLDDTMLRDHIRQLKLAWCRGRRFIAQAG